MRCIVIIHVGPGQQETAKHAQASVKTAIAHSPGPFSDISVKLIDDTLGALGRSAARNNGVKKALQSDVEWLFFLDADDLMLNTAFESVNDYVENYDGLWGAIAEIAPGESQPTLRPQQISGLSSIDSLLAYEPYLTLQMGHFVRTKIAAQFKFNETMHTGEDVDYYLRVWERSRCIKFDKPLFINRRGITSAGQYSGNVDEWNKTAKEIYALFRKRRNISEPAPQFNLAGISHVFRMDINNPGDWYSAPLHYLPFTSKTQVIDITTSNMPDMQNTMIIGGGGLISPHFTQMGKILGIKNSSKIGWGLGYNMVIDTETSFVPETDFSWPNYVDQFDLLGVRDYGHKYRWLPCASCLHPALSIDIPATHEIVVYEHKGVPLNISGFPRMKNNGNRIERSLDFLRSGELILTNSYHGAYWGQLLGRRVIAFPFSHKFYGLKHSLPLCKPEEWKKYIDKAEVHPNALQECRQANITFFNDFEKLAENTR